MKGMNVWSPLSETCRGRPDFRLSLIKTPKFHFAEYCFQLSPRRCICLLPSRAIFPPASKMATSVPRQQINYLKTAFSLKLLLAIGQKSWVSLRLDHISHVPIP